MRFNPIEPPTQTIPPHDRTRPYLEDSSALKRPYAEAFGKYTLCLKLAAGSSSVVYLAMFRGTDGLQRPVIIKRLHAYLANRVESVEMFFDEAQLAAVVSHPAVCALHDFGRSKQTYFLAMEYLIGETLEHLASQLLSHPDQAQMERVPRYISRIAADICEGLHAVHGASDTSGQTLQIVHGDITPRNLFALYDGSVRVTDFGSARTGDRSESMFVGFGKGKVAYMSPEQLSRAPIDRRSDIWSLGVVLWELLTQRSLFSQETVTATVSAIQQRQIPAPSTINPVVPAALDQIVLRALERSPEKRYADARAFSRALESFLSSCKDTIAPSELGVWLEALFPGEAERRRGLVHIARSMVESSRVAPPPLKPVKLNVSDATLAHVPRAARANDNNAPGGNAAAGGMNKWLVPGLALLCLLLAAGFFAFRMFSEKPPAPTQTTAPGTP